MSNTKDIKFLSNENITFVIENVRNKLCIKDIKPNNEFVKSIVRIMQRIYRKYPGNKLESLNKLAIKQIVDYYLPEKRVKQSIFDTFLPTTPVPEGIVTFRPSLKPDKTVSEESKILRGRVTGTKRGIRSKVPGTEIKRATLIKAKKRVPIKTPVKKITKDYFFSSGKTEYRPETSTFHNINNNLFYNPKLNLVYNPKLERFYKGDTGILLEPGTKDTDLETFFGMKKATIIDRVTPGSKLGYYESGTGTILTPGKSIPTAFGQVPGKVDVTAQTVSNEAIITEYSISIDSRHRDIRIFPSASRYSIAFQNRSQQQFGFLNNMSDVIRGTTRVELVDGLVPNILKASATTTPDTYFLLTVEEVIGRYFNSSPLGRNIFGKLRFALDSPPDINYIEVEPIMAFRDYSPEPLSTVITSITVNILNFNGNLVDFGQDSFKLRYWQDSGVGTTIITTWLPHNLTTGDIVYFRFTENRILDEQLDGISVLVVSTTVFTVPLDSSTVAAGLAPNIGGPPVNQENPEASSGIPFPTIPPNDPTNPTTFFGFILKPELQNSFIFKIITKEKSGTQITTEQLAKLSSGY